MADDVYFWFEGDGWYWGEYGPFDTYADMLAHYQYQG